jgi:hypothetical protein
MNKNCELQKHGVKLAQTLYERQDKTQHKEPKQKLHSFAISLTYVTRSKAFRKKLTEITIGGQKLYCAVPVQ